MSWFFTCYLAIGAGYGLYFAERQHQRTSDCDRGSDYVFDIFAAGLLWPLMIILPEPRP